MLLYSRMDDYDFWGEQIDPFEAQSDAYAQDDACAEAADACWAGDDCSEFDGE